MAAKRKLPDNRSINVVAASGKRKGVPAPLKTASRPPSAAVRGQDRMPNGDPPRVMLWGDDR